jgi:CheY-like chemotaxis protein
VATSSEEMLTQVSEGAGMMAEPRERRAQAPSFASDGPSRKSSQKRVSNDSKGPSAIPKSKIVVADDEPLVAVTLREILVDEGFEVVTVADGNAAVQAAQAMRPDLVLTDVMMPKMNGIEAAKAIKRFLPDCRIILLSGQAATGALLKQAHEEGHDFEIVTKPIKPETLLEILRKPMDHD